jgi:phage-related minor tail protein
MGIEEKAKTLNQLTLFKVSCFAEELSKQWVPLKDYRKLEQTCKELAGDLQETIDVAVDLIRDYQKQFEMACTCADEYEEKAEKFKKEKFALGEQLAEVTKFNNILAAKIDAANYILAEINIVNGDLLDGWLGRLREALNTGDNTQEAK